MAESNGARRARAGGTARTVASSALVAWLVAAAAVSRPAGAAAQVVNFRHYTGAEGMPQAQVFAVAQDRRGYMWFGSYGGLSRFDGRRFYTYEVAHGLISNSVFDVVEAADGRLVIGTSRGVCLKQDEVFDCVGAEQGLAHAEVRTVAPDDSGGVWVGGMRGAAYVRAGSVRNFGVAEGLPGEWVQRLAIDSAGQVWAATDRGLARYAGGHFVHERPDLLPGGVQFIRVVRGGVLLGSEGRLYMLRGRSLTRLPGDALPEGIALTDGTVAPDGGIWLASRSGVLRVADGQVQRFTRQSGLRTELINRVLLDREGLLWFGTESGATKHVPGPFQTYTEAEGLPHAFVRAINTDASGRLWVGGRNGVAYRDGERFVSVALKGLTDRRVWSLLANPDGGMLVGTRHGLLAWTPQGQRLYGEADGLPHEVVYSLVADGQGGAWAGTHRGLVHWQRGRIEHVQPAGLGSVGIISLKLDSRGRLWLGTLDHGLALLEGDSVRKFGEAQGGSDRTIWSIAEDAQGTIWAGTNGDGVLRVTDAGVTRLTTRNGLASNFIWQVLRDSREDIWLFGNLGLNRLSGTSIHHYGRGSGLIELEGAAGAAFEDAAGSLWFGTGSGVIRYTPELQVASATAPPVYIEEATVSGEAFDVAGREARIGRGTIRVRFTAPSFRDEAATRFRYRLVGAGDEWSSETTDESVTFAGLAPGHYRFEVVALNADRTSEQPAVLAFYVLPAFWQTWWFRGLGVLLLFGLAAAAPAWRARSLEQERRRLAALVEQHTRELAEKNERLETSNRDLEYFAYIASHDLQEPLRKIQAFSDRVRGQYSDRLDATGQDYLARMTGAASRMQSLIDDLLSLSRVNTKGHPMQYVELPLLVRDVVGDLEIRMQTTQGRVEVDDLPAVWGDAVQLRQLFQNLIGNALKFHRPDVPPVVRVRVAAHHGDRVEIHVEDNGIGFEAKDAERVFQPFLRLHGRSRYEGSGIGLAICQKIVLRHNGRIRAESEPGVGTRFIMTLPTRNDEKAGVPHAA